MSVALYRGRGKAAAVAVDKLGDPQVADAARALVTSRSTRAEVTDRMARDAAFTAPIPSGLSGANSRQLAVLAAEADALTGPTGR